MKQRIMTRCQGFALLVVLTLLSACGGGGDGGNQFQAPTACLNQNLSACGALPVDSTVTTPTTNGIMTLALLDKNGNPANVLDGTGPLSATVRLTDATGKPVSGAVVKFSTDTALAMLSVTSALTDANGAASVVLTLASPSAAGAATLNATSSYATAANPSANATLSGSANFKVGGTVSNTPASVVLVAISPADKSILLKNVIGTGRVQTAQVIFKVTGNNGQPVVNQKVKFSFQPSNADLTFASDTGITGQNGEVTAVVNAGNTVTVAAVRIAVVDLNDNPVLDKNGAPIWAVSDQITATNTLLNPDGITLTTTRFMLESINVVGEPAVLTVRLADLQGGGITNGVAVAFTTDGGYIIGKDTAGNDTDSAKCTTINGSCSVKLVPAQPMPPEGIATVKAMVQLDSAIVTKEIHIAMSGAFARFTGDFVVDATAGCDPQMITFNLADVNGNGMPEGSKLSIRGALNASATIINDTVKYPFSLRGGTTHQAIVSPGSNCSAAGTRIVEGSFTLLLTTPFGIESSQVVRVRYRAT